MKPTLFVVCICLVTSSAQAWKPKDIHSGFGDSYGNAFNDRFYMPPSGFGVGAHGLGNGLPPNGWIFQGDPNLGLPQHGQQQLKCARDPRTNVYGCQYV